MRQGCRKGKRECNYPGTGSSTKPSRRDSKVKSASTDGSSPSDEDEGIDDKFPLSAIPDDDEDMDDDDMIPTSATSDSLQLSGLSTATNAQPLSPTLESPTILQRPARPQPARSHSKHSIKFSIQQHRNWASLPKDVRKFLLYHKEHLSYHHYAFKYDGGDFLKTTFLEIALNDQSHSLLFAIVAFSCYHYVMKQEDETTSLETFLKYYNQSIMLLQASLKRKKPNITTLLTILQLATIEVSSKDTFILAKQY